MTEHRRGWRMMGADGALTLVLSLLLMLVTAGLSWLLATLRVLQVGLRASNRIAPADWILVLGRQLLGGAVTLDYAARLNRAAAQAGAQPQARILVVGGHTSEGPFTEATQGRNFLIQRGIEPGRIQTEDGSRHTLENLQAARDELGDRPGRLMLVTSRYHLARSQTLARGLGLEVQLCAAESGWLWSPRVARRLLLEGFYLHWYGVAQCWALLMRSDKAWPASTE